MNHDKNSKGLQSAQKRKNDEKKKESGKCLTVIYIMCSHK